MRHQLRSMRITVARPMKNINNHCQCFCQKARKVTQILTRAGRSMWPRKTTKLSGSLSGGMYFPSRHSLNLALSLVRNPGCLFRFIAQTHSMYKGSSCQLKEASRV
jgi:hypothetical protein